MEEHQSEGHPVSGNEEELEQPTNVDVTTTKSPKKGKRTAKRKSIAQPKGRQTADPSGKQQDAEKNAEKQQADEPSTRKSPRTRSGVQGTAPTTQRSGKRKHPENEQPETQTAVEPTPLPKFIDDEARERFEWISQKGFITQRTIIPYEFRKLDLESVLNLFEFQKWTHLLTIPNTYYPDMLHQFFANLRKGKSHTDLISRVNSVNIELNPEIVNSVLETKIEDGFKGKIVNFFSYEEFSSAYHHFHVAKLMTYFQSHFNTPAEARLEDLSPQNLIIFTIISNLLVPTDGHRTDANKMELYLFYCFLEKFELILALSCANFCSKSALTVVGNCSMKNF